MNVARMCTSLTAACALAFGMSVHAQQTQGQGAAGAQTGSQSGAQSGSQTGAQSGSQTGSQTGSQSGQPSQAGRTASSAAGSITLTGCLERDTAAGASAQAGQAGASFKLTDVEATAGSTAGAAAGGAGMDNDEYRLMASSDVNLSQHVDHQVRVTGTLSPASSSGASSSRSGSSSSTTGSSSTGSMSGGGASMPGAQPGGSSSAGGAAGASSAGADTPTLHVTDVTMISASCD